MMSSVHHRASHPAATHWRQATCREVDCEKYLKGYKTVVPVGHFLVDKIRHTFGKHFTEERVGDALIAFVFPAGQLCWESAVPMFHKLPLGRMPILTRRANHDLRRMEPDRWIDSYNEGVHWANENKKRG